jgi:hypothetical protein
MKILQFWTSPLAKLNASQCKIVSACSFQDLETTLQAQRTSKKSSFKEYWPQSFGHKNVRKISFEMDGRIEPWSYRVEVVRAWMIATIHWASFTSFLGGDNLLYIFALFPIIRPPTNQGPCQLETPQDWKCNGQYDISRSKGRVGVKTLMLSCINLTPNVIQFPSKYYI